MANAKKTTTIIAVNMGRPAPSAMFPPVLLSHVTRGPAYPRNAKETKWSLAMRASIRVEPDTIIVTKMAVAAPTQAAWAPARSPSNGGAFSMYIQGG